MSNHIERHIRNIEIDPTGCTITTKDGGRVHFPPSSLQADFGLSVTKTLAAVTLTFFAETFTAETDTKENN